jgi:hypothetical protein
MPVNQSLTRQDVERAVRDGGRWVVTYCAGAHQEPTTGRGAPLPPGVLERVPSAAALRKITRGQSRKTYLHAVLARHGDEFVVELTEG